MFSVLIAALLLDWIFAESRRLHPLVGFGKLATWVESLLNCSSVQHLSGRGAGILAYLLVTLPWVIASIVAEALLAGHWAYYPFAALLLYYAIGWQSLLQHAQAVIHPLTAHDMIAARQKVAMIVSRDTSALDDEGVARAATESVLENGADAIFSVIFWFCLLGMPGIVVYRLTNTLDAMWGYKNPRFLYFGWLAARMDDVLNYIPARLTALSYALLGNTASALHCWRLQGVNWKSPNAGPVMAAGAGALDVRLGGVAVYHNQQQLRPQLGMGKKASVVTLKAACQLVNRSVLLWCIAVAIINGVTAWLS